MRFFLATLILVGAAAAAAPTDFGPNIRPLLAKYCFSCHGEEKQEGGIALHELHTTEDAFRKHRLLRQLIAQIESDDMPPFETKEELPDEDRSKLDSIIKILSTPLSLFILNK